MSIEMVKMAMGEMDGEEGGKAWIVTFADMMTLILVFFVLLYTISELEDKAYKAKIATINIIDGEGNQLSVIDYATRSGRNPQPVRLVEDLLGLNPSPDVIVPPKPAIAQELEGMIDNTDLSDSVDMAVEGDVILITIDGRFVFSSGKATLTKDAFEIFSQLTRFFYEHADYTIAIRGHTDDRDIETKEFPSNWELSAVRATSVLRYFIRQGIDPERMTATGYADFIPVAPNDTAENRAKNRRVEFVLEKEKDS